VTDLRTDLDNLNLVIDFAVLDDELDRSPRLWCAAFVGAAAWFTSYPNEAKYVWRGHASAAWALQPRLHRHVARHLGSSSRDRVDQERRRILADAEHNGWNYVQGRRIVGMELLARLQHHGVPTSLLDVTRDPLVAMFFAVAQAKDEAGSNADGALIAIRDPEVTVSETGTEKPRRRFSPSSAWYGVWPAPPIDPRITSQRGEFIVLNESKAHSGSASSHPPQSKKLNRDRNREPPRFIHRRQPRCLFQGLSRAKGAREAARQPGKCRDADHPSQDEVPPEDLSRRLGNQ
jgi:hypothetical protein